MKEAIDLDDLSDNDRRDPPPVIDPVRLRRLLILRLYATGESAAVIAQVFRCSRRRVYQEIGSIDPEIGTRAIG